MGVRVAVAAALFPASARTDQSASRRSPRGSPAVDGHGHREIVLTGIHLGLYGSARRAKPRRASSAGCDVEREYRVRLSSLEAVEITPELIGVMADHPHRVCARAHLLQSGSGEFLPECAVAVESNRC